MHPEARNGFTIMLAQALAWRGVPLPDFPIVLDLGGADNNGTVHDLLPSTSMIDVLDKVKAPGVNIVADAATWDTPARYDIVIATEVFEHAQEWPAIVGTAHKALHDGGIFITTCASDGRPEHGAWGDPLPSEDEWYCNVSQHDLRACLHQTGFRVGAVEYQPDPGDLYAWAVK